MIKTFFKLLRVKQYIKNVLLFAPVFFASNIVNINTLIKLLIAFIGFSLVTSFIYILNDIKDKNADANHETKCKRPVASGAIKVKSALLTALFCICLGLFICHNIYVYLYILINLLYVFKLKQYALLDIIVIALGYLIRLFIGGSISNVELSPWIIIMTFLLALFLASSKRYDDLKYIGPIRDCSLEYNSAFLESLMSILASITVVAYIIYTLSAEIIEKFNCEYLYMTSLFVLVGILRYLQITFVLKKSGSPTDIIYKDWFIKITVLLWIASFTCIIYL